MPATTVTTFDGRGNIVDQSSVVVPDAVVNADLLRVRAQAALAANTAYLAVATPTNAQVIAQVQRLTKQNSALIRLLIQLTEDVSDTV